MFWYVTPKSMIYFSLQFLSGISAVQCLLSESTLKIASKNLWPVDNEEKNWNY